MSHAVAEHAALSTQAVAQSAKAASRALAPLDGTRRNAALEAMALALEAASDKLLAANAEDMKLAESLHGAEALPPATLSRLKLNEAKLREMVEQVRSVAALPDPLGRVLDAVELDDKDAEGAVSATRSLTMQKISVPLGVLAVIFEARPDAVTQIAALALKSGNAAILKPGREVEHTATALVKVLRTALASQGISEDAISLVRGRERVNELLGMHSLVDMVIPRGSKQLIEYVQAHTRIPVLGHAEGVCHIYVDRAADQELALRVIEDAKTDYPAACNAVETVLVHREIAAEFLPRLAERMCRRGVTLYGDAVSQVLMGGAAPVDDWHTEYGELAISVAGVRSLEAAIEHIHTHGSLHTESIITEDSEAAETFLREVDAAGVMHNASTRFADGFRYGFGAEVGISTSKFHARGPVGLDGLTTYKYVVRGHGHIAGDYRGAQGADVHASAFGRSTMSERIAIIGTGLIGASVGLALKASGFEGEVVGFDANPAESAKALEMGAVDRVFASRDEVLADDAADIYVLAVPVLVVLDWMQKLAAATHAGQLITDVGSTKVEICRLAETLFNGPGQAAFLPGHPMAGKESGGAALADATLFRGATWLFTPIAAGDTPLAELWRELVATFGAAARDMDQGDHDEVCAWVSHLPQMLSTALAALLEETFAHDPEGMAAVQAIGGRALRETTRLGASPYSMWRDVAMTNTKPIAETLLALEQRLAHLRENLRTPELRDEFALANLFRAKS